MGGFWYTFLNRIQYWSSRDKVKKCVISHNYSSKRIWIKRNAYYIPELEIELPKGEFDFVFDRFSVFVRIAKILKGSYQIENSKLIFRFNDFKLAITTAEELFIIEEIFVNHCYDFRFPQTDSIVVVDIGMNVGFASLFFAAKNNVTSVFSYEPFPNTYQDALLNFSLNEKLSKKVCHFNFGLSNNDEQIDVNYNKFLKGKNKTQQLGQDKSFKEKYTIQLRSAKGIINEINLDGRIAVMKIDCEGAEYEIFRSFNGYSLPSQIKVVILERHGDGQDMLIDYLVNNGFVTLKNGSLETVGMIYAFRA